MYIYTYAHIYEAEMMIKKMQNTSIILAATAVLSSHLFRGGKKTREKVEKSAG